MVCTFDLRCQEYCAVDYRGSIDIEWELKTRKRYHRYDFKTVVQHGKSLKTKWR